MLLFMIDRLMALSPLATDIWSGGQFESMLNLGQSERFTILIDRITDSVQSSALPISDKAYVKCDLDQLWSGALGTAASCNTGTLWLFMANNSDIAIGTASVVDFLRELDILMLKLEHTCNTCEKAVMT